MAESKTPQQPCVDNYDVFLSFRGADTRNGFIGHLYLDLKDAGIRVFLDNHELTYGERLDEELPQAIDNSRIYIPILSETYASSKWCLRELTRMVRNKRISSEGDKQILPVFYRVTTDDVKLKTDLYQNQLAAHGITTEVEEWKKALQCIPERRGWELPSSILRDAEVCREIIKRVSVILKVKYKQVPEVLVGMEDPIESLMNLLDIKSPNMQVIGIHGMGGIGQTTLAKVVYNKLCDSFDCCSFIADVRESLDKNGSKGCIELQKKLLKDICRQGEDRDISDVDDAISTIQRILKGKSVLMVFDDVSEPNHIKRLIGNNYDSCLEGSRIIVTTRDIRALQIRGFAIIKVHEMEEMKKEHALQLFSWHAFGRPSPQEEYSLLSSDVLNLTGGLPLSLEVIGSLLFREGKEKWKYIIERLKKIPVKEVQERLKISYENLTDEAKEIFLDIACFFVDEEQGYEVYMWEACDFFPQSGTDELVSMCLIKMKAEDKFCTRTGGKKTFKRYWMHDHIKDLGREIVRQEGFKDPKQCSRFWRKEDALNILGIRKKENNNNIHAICISDLERVDVDDGTWTLRRENFVNLNKLRFLQLNRRTHWVTGEIDVKLEVTFEHVLPNLRWLVLHRLPLQKFNVTKFNLRKLVILDLTNSDISETWGGWKEFKGLHSLEVLDLTDCQRLKKIPVDLFQCTSLKRLILDACYNLEEIDRSIMNLSALKSLCYHKCASLSMGLPEEVFSLVHLEEIIGNFNFNKTMMKIPESVGELTSLVKLKITRLQMVALPDSIGRLVNLQSLNLEWGVFESLPDSIGGLVKLRHLVLSHCTVLVSLPDSLTSLPKFERLVLSECGNLVSLPDSVGEMVNLKEIDISDTGLKKLPRFIAMQKKLEKLIASGTKLEGVPTEIEELPYLRVLNLANSRICGLPSLSQLIRLEKFNLDGCNQLDQRLHLELPTSLVNLTISVVAALQSVPDLSHMSNLTNLKLAPGPRKSDWSNLVQPINELQLSIWKLSKWKWLRLDIEGFTSTIIPSEFVNVSQQLSKFTLQCSELEISSAGVPPFSSSRLRELVLSVNKITTSLSQLRLNRLEILKLSNCEDLRVVPGLEELESLEHLQFIRCSSLERLDLSKLRVHLKSLEIKDCKKLKVILGLKTPAVLEITDCESLESLAVGLSESENKTSSKAQDDGNSGEAKGSKSAAASFNCTLVYVGTCPMLKDFQCLKGLDLRALTVKNCTSLKMFNPSEIHNSPNLMVSPGLELLKSLKMLSIYNCPLVENNCNQRRSIL